MAGNSGLLGPVAGLGGRRYKGASRGKGYPFALLRRVAQPGRALRSGRRGRRFESSLSDHSFLRLAGEETPVQPTNPMGHGFPGMGAPVAGQRAGALMTARRQHAVVKVEK